MKAIVKVRPEFDGTDILDVPKPKHGAKDVLVKIKCASICGTDYHIFKWDSWAAENIKTPLLYGHEFSGEVVELGAEVKNVKIGDAVSGECHIYCGKCRQCLNGLKHACRNVVIFGVDSPGIFAEYAVIPEGNIWKNDPSLPWEITSIQDPLGNAVHSVYSADVRGKDVVVLGMGPIGAMCVLLAKRRGAKRVFAVDKGNKYRLKIAKEMGADFALDADKAADNIIMDETCGAGVDVVLEMSGSSGAIAPALKLLTFGGTLILLGVYADHATVDFSNDVVFKYATIKGITGRRIFGDWEIMKALLKDADFVAKLKKIITHKFKLEEFHKAMEVIKSGECCKVVLTV